MFIRIKTYLLFILDVFPANFDAQLPAQPRVSISAALKNTKLATGLTDAEENALQQSSDCLTAQSKVEPADDDELLCTSTSFVSVVPLLSKGILQIKRQLVYELIYVLKW